MDRSRTSFTMISVARFCSVFPPSRLLCRAISHNFFQNVVLGDKNCWPMSAGSIEYHTWSQTCKRTCSTIVWSSGAQNTCCTSCNNLKELGEVLKSTLRVDIVIAKKRFINIGLQWSADATAAANIWNGCSTPEYTSYVYLSFLYSTKNMNLQWLHSLLWSLWLHIGVDQPEEGYNALISQRRPIIFDIDISNAIIVVVIASHKHFHHLKRIM